METRGEATDLSRQSTKSCQFEDKTLKVCGRDCHFLLKEGSGKNIIFLHGWGMDCSAFLFAAKGLREDRCALVDLAGFGKSEAPASGAGVGDYARDVFALMDMLGMDSACLVGHSFGGRVAIEMAATCPERVDGLALVDSAGIKPIRGPRYFFKVFAHKLLRKLGRAGLGGSADYRALPESMRQTFKNVVNYDQSPLLAHILCPTAIFWGREDRVTPPYMARKFERRIGNSALFWLNGGHFAYAEDASVFLPVLFAFIKELKSNDAVER